MFNSLIKAPFNKVHFAVLSFSILLIPGCSFFGKLACIISLYQLFLLFYSLNTNIPIRHLFGFFMCLQFLIGPTLVYNGFEKFQYIAYRMQISEWNYFKYAIPGVVAFIFGLSYVNNISKAEVINCDETCELIKRNKVLPYLLVVFGFLMTIIKGYVNPRLQFPILLFENLKYAGAFMMLYLKGRYRWWIIIFVFGVLLYQSIMASMFYDLLIWLIFLGIYFCNRYQPGKILKLGLGFLFLFLVFFIQSEKYVYRTVINSNSSKAGVSTFVRTYWNEISNNKSYFTKENLAPAISRVNQGFILSYIIKNVPYNVPFENGRELVPIIKSAVFPRILLHDKIKSGDMVSFHKYTPDLNYSGSGTTMALSSMGDAYINFGLFGGVVFMFLFGVVNSYILNLIGKMRIKNQLIVFFIPLIFYYPIRPDTALQTILGFLVKSTFTTLLFVFLFDWLKIVPRGIPNIFIICRRCANNILKS